MLAFTSIVSNFIYLELKLATKYLGYFLFCFFIWVHDQYASIVLGLMEVFPSVKLQNGYVENGTRASNMVASHKWVIFWFLSELSLQLNSCQANQERSQNMFLIEKSLLCCSLLFYWCEIASNKTASTAASRLISVAAARLAVASCLSSLSSSVVSKGSQQLLLPVFITTRRKLIPYGILRSTENALYWTRKTSELKLLESCCFAGFTFDIMIAILILTWLIIFVHDVSSQAFCPWLHTTDPSSEDYQTSLQIWSAFNREEGVGCSQKTCWEETSCEEQTGGCQRRSLTTCCVFLWFSASLIVLFCCVWKSKALFGIEPLFLSCWRAFPSVVRFMCFCIIVCWLPLNRSVICCPGSSPRSPTEKSESHGGREGKTRGTAESPT